MELSECFNSFQSGVISLLGLTLFSLYTGYVFGQDSILKQLKKYQDNRRQQITSVDELREFEQLPDWYTN